MWTDHIFFIASCRWMLGLLLPFGGGAHHCCEREHGRDCVLLSAHFPFLWAQTGGGRAALAPCMAGGGAQTVFCSGCTARHPHRPCTGVRFSTFSPTVIFRVSDTSPLVRVQVDCGFHLPFLSEAWRRAPFHSAACRSGTCRPCPDRWRAEPAWE